MGTSGEGHVEAAAPPPAVRAALSLPERVGLVKDVMYIVAIVVAGVWGITTFWYQSSYLPAHERPLVTPSMTLTVIGEKGSQVVVNAHLVLKNEGKSTQNTWGLTFHAFGRRVTAAPTLDGGWSDKTETPTSFEAFRDHREEKEIPLASFVDMMTAPGRNNPIQPHTELQWDFHFYVDRASADLVEVAVDVLYPPTDVRPKPEWFELKPGDEGIMEIVPTAACRATRECVHFHTNFVKIMSLWK